MARALTFIDDDDTFEVAVEKVDRKKVYGWVDRKPVDREGNSCFLGSVSADGLHIFSRESFEMGHVDSQGRWVEKSELQAVDSDGEALEKEESSFKQQLKLEETVSIDFYLDHIVKSVYEIAEPGELLAKVQASEAIFTFPFNYTASYEPSPAFLIENDGTLFMVVGQPAGFEFISKPEVENVVLFDEEDEESAADDLDFSMM